MLASILGMMPLEGGGVTTALAVKFVLVAAAEKSREVGLKVVLVLLGVTR